MKIAIYTKVFTVSQLVKMTVEAALGAELDQHLGYVKHDPAGRGSGNSRNGTTSKGVIRPKPCCMQRKTLI